MSAAKGRRCCCKGGEGKGFQFKPNSKYPKLDTNFLKCGVRTLVFHAQENVRLKKCSLAWNGFGPEGGAAIADALMTNNSLQDIDISGNRLSADVAIKVAKAIMNNDNIRTLKVGMRNVFHSLVQVTTL